jgi:chaperonin GroES
MSIDPSAAEAIEDPELGETLELDGPEDEVIENEDGSAVIRLKDQEDTDRNLEHFANMVEEVDQRELSDIVVELLEKIERDKEAREKRDKLYEEGLRRTGLGDDAPGGAQFSGATKIVHPMLVEACVDFSARAMKELFPSNGPVRAKVMGLVDKTKAEKARRKSEFMNWQATEQMPEFRGELEQLSTQLPLGGGQYLKAMWSPQWKRPTVEFVPIDNIFLPFAATNFYTAERKTHVQYITAFEYDKRVRIGMYRDVDVPTPEMPEFSKASKANDRIEGRKETSYNEDGLRTVFEVYTHLSFDDEGPSPYIISIDHSTKQALSLYRNWDKDETGDTDERQELEWIVEFPFVPWRGAYPIGLTHMIGGLSGAATGALRALLDSAHIQNIPTMLKLKGGPNGQSLTLQPTQVAEIEGGVMVDDIRKVAMPVPFNPPSPTLFQLLGFLVDAGKGVVQTSFEKLSDQNPNMPVGTTVALIEQGMVVFSSIHARLHNSMDRVLKIIHRINGAYLTQEMIDAQAGHLEVKPSDFDGPMDVIPVSDPNTFSETQRFARAQAIMQRSAAMPQLYDQRKVEEMFLSAIRVDDDILTPSVGQDDIDPVSENVAASMGRPVYVLPKQDHMAHLKLHMAFLMSPLFGQNPAIMSKYLFPMAQHLRDHLLNYYLTECHSGVHEAEKTGLVDSDANQQAQLVARIQAQVEQELASFGPILAQITQQAQQFAPQPPMPPDNSLMIAKMSNQLQGQALQQKAQADEQKFQLSAQKAQQDAALEAEKLRQAEADRQSEMQREEMRQMAETQRTQMSDAMRERMNQQDNQTAMRITTAEIMSGEKTNISTGTGINP